MAADVVRIMLGSALLALGLAQPMAAQVGREAVPARDMVIIHGTISGKQARWLSYQNGGFSQDSYTNHYFMVPRKKTLVVMELDLFTAGDTRKQVSLDLVVNEGKFPLARATFSNPGGAPAFTASRTFAPGLAIPERGVTGQQGLLGVQVFNPKASATYEVTLHGYYTE